MRARCGSPRRCRTPCATVVGSVESNRDAPRRLTRSAPSRLGSHVTGRSAITTSAKALASDR
jgi:hypothetical protein